jgi:hypothetical protein
MISGVIFNSSKYQLSDPYWSKQDARNLHVETNSIHRQAFRIIKMSCHDIITKKQVTLILTIDSNERKIGLP